MAAADDPDGEVVGHKHDEKRSKGLQENLRPYHALGFRVPRDGQHGGKVIEHTGDESIVYLVGKHVAVYSYEGSSHRFIPKHPKTIDIVAFAVSCNKRYVALSERVLDEESGDTGVQISIYNFNTASKVRTLSLSKIGKQPVEAMDFSRDNKYLVTISAPPDPFIHFWQLDKARLLRYAELRVRISQVTVSPWAHWTMCTSGPSSLRIWRFQDKELKAVDPVPKRNTKDYHFTCHAWFDEDRVIVGTQEGDVLVVDGSELRKVIVNVFGTSGDTPTAVWAMYSVGRGFICGGDGGAFAVYERTYDSEYFQCYKIFTTPTKRKIIDISISPSEESLVCCYDNNELSLFGLTNIDVMDHEKEEDVAQAFRNLPVGFHSDTITGFDVCMQKSIVVTTSMDKCVRIWNFMKKRLEIKKECDEEALSVSCHPTGMRILIGFKYKMCMYNVLLDDLHMCQEFPIKQCREVRFSHGGQFFAAVVVNRIFIFNAYTFDAIGHLTGHSSMVKSFSWMRNDQGIVSAGFEGAVYEWRTDSCKRNESSEYVHKSIAFSTVCYDDSAQLVAAVGSHKVADPPHTAEGEVSLRVLKLSETSQAVRSAIPLGMARAKHSHTRSHSREVALSSSAQCLFAGTPTGQLQVFKWPMKSANPDPDISIDLHHGEIWFLILSVDDRFLFTVGEDHCLFMFDVDSLLVDGRSAVAKRTMFNYNLFDDVAFVLHQDIDDRIREINQLQTQLNEEQRARKQERESTEQHYSLLLQQTENDAKLRIEGATDARESAESKRVASEQRMMDEARAIEGQRMRDIQELEALHSKRTKDQSSKYERLSEEKADLIVRYENKILKMQKEREQEQKHFEQELKTLQESRDKLVEQLTRDHSHAVAESEGLLKDTEMEHDRELQQLEKKYQEMLEEKEKFASKAQSEVDMYKRRFDKHETEKKDMTKELLDKEKEKVRKDAEIADLKKSIQTLRLEINVRNDTISASEKKILELKKQTAELEKLRYVLTFKFNELRKEVAPKDDSIKQMKERIQQMDDELEKIGIDRDMMTQKIVGREEKILVVVREVQRLHRQIDDQHRMLQLLLRDLNELVTDTEPKRVVYGLRDVIDKYTKKFEKEHEPVDKEKQAEFERQRFYMEAQLSTLKKQNIRREEHMKADSQRKTAENALLVREINDLRHEKKLLTQRLQMADSQLKEARTSTVVQRQPTGRGSPSAASASGSGTQEPLFSAAPLGSPPPASGGSPKSQVKGKVFRGSTRTMRDVAKMDPAKIADLVQLVDKNNADMVRQQEEIQRLRDFIQHLLLRQKADATSGQTDSPPPADPDAAAAQQQRASLRPSSVRGSATPEPSSGAPALPSLPPRPATEAR
eukprot:TRINITY_DN11686_c4_g1_i1.p1 TRINITY_DN11686_c4_g1~~TRINITY_DN11686_c4_g1_i1.p1  ORF type:complete len:1358 (+),score=552.17 TRINITY_DN11686_c4_g1_i1:68-4141(+)